MDLVCFVGVQLCDEEYLEEFDKGKILFLPVLLRNRLDPTGYTYKKESLYITSSKSRLEKFYSIPSQKIKSSERECL